MIVNRQSLSDFILPIETNIQISRDASNKQIMFVKKMDGNTYLCMISAPLFHFQAQSTVSGFIRRTSACASRSLSRKSARL